jgi:hypothetical protein
MTEMRPGRSRKPWVVAGVLVLVVAGLATLLVIVVNRFNQPNRVTVAFSKNEQAAMDAARQTVINQFSYSRKNYDSDFQRALDGTTGSLHSDILAEKAKILSQMNAGKFDLTASVSDTALASSDGKTQANVLVYFTAYIVNASGTAPNTVTRFSVTMQKVGNKWLASDAQNIGLV